MIALSDNQLKIMLFFKLVDLACSSQNFGDIALCPSLKCSKSISTPTPYTVHMNRFSA